MRTLIQRFALVRQARKVARFSSETLHIDQTRVRNYTDKGNIESGTPRLRYIGHDQKRPRAIIISEIMLTMFECNLRFSQTKCENMYLMT